MKRENVNNVSFYYSDHAFEHTNAVSHDNIAHVWVALPRDW